jgi:uncharacterized membrane protein YfcA
VTFLAALDFSEYWRVVLGLIIGGAVAAPLAGFLSRFLPPRTLLLMVAVVIAVLSTYTLARLALTIVKALG